MEVSTEGELVFRGGVWPRLVRVEFDVEEDRSGGAGLLENSLRKAFPTLEARLFARVSSVFEIEYKLPKGARTIPGDGTADNLLMLSSSLLEAS